ncbi:MAG TPA: substrate-binding domain-containing protein [Acetobacteraceae bacterium]|nr:substrate-binding domain-containing protein [Acetobacteraceae bacterium]
MSKSGVAVMLGLALAAWGSGASRAAQPQSSGGAGGPNNGASFLASAEAATAGRTGLQTQWTGPTSGPRIAPAKHIICIPTDMKNTLSAEWMADIAAIGKKIGWKVEIIDGQGTASGWTTAFNQAIALHPDGIVSSANADTVQPEVDNAAKRGIVIVGLHFTSVPGADPKRHVFYNIESSPEGIGKAEADYIIALSHGKGRAIILYDAEYAVARYKAEAMRTEFAKCGTCKLLAYVNLPLSQVSTLTPQAVSSWITHYGLPFYVMTIADYYYDFAVPVLTQGAVARNGVNLVGSDGAPSAYDRIRNGLYQTATVPEPAEEQAYQAIDEFNRAFHGQPPFDYVPPAFLVTAQNIHTQGGDQNQFNPANGYAQHYLTIWGFAK